MIAPGQTRTYWALFRGYRFADSDHPRRITLRVPGPDGQTLELRLADPSHGLLRWSVEPLRSGWTVALQTTSLLGSHLRADAPATAIVHRRRIGPILLDLGLVSTIMIQIQGTLVSSTSSFTASGLSASISYPLLSWGSAQDPRQIGVFGGGAGHVLVEIPTQTAIEARARLHLYGVLAAETGIEFDVGSLRFADTPFPLSPAGRALPRWSARLGYTRWRLDGGSTDGYVTSMQLAW